MNRREQFEKWATKQGYNMTKLPDRDEYASLVTIDCWSAWQASRECMGVELPKKELMGSYRGIELYVYEATQTEKALEAQGIKVKT